VYMSTVTQAQHLNLETARQEMERFGKEIREYLTKVEANVEGYKFSVEKRGEGIEVEVEFKALIHPKARADIPR
jgi:hypothetical protein